MFQVLIPVRLQSAHGASSQPGMKGQSRVAAIQLATGKLFEMKSGQQVIQFRSVRWQGSAPVLTDLGDVSA